MALYVGETPVLSLAGFTTLMRQLPEDFEDPVLTALFLGEDVSPDEFRRALDIRVRAAAHGRQADALIDAALAALDGETTEGPDPLEGH